MSFYDIPCYLSVVFTTKDDFFVVIFLMGATNLFAKFGCGVAENIILYCIVRKTAHAPVAQWIE